MTGSEVETTVDASIDTNMPSSSPMRAGSTRRGAAVSGREEVMRGSPGEEEGCRDDVGALVDEDQLYAKCLIRVNYPSRSASARYLSVGAGGGGGVRPAVVRR